MRVFQRVKYRKHRFFHEIREKYMYSIKRCKNLMERDFCENLHYIHNKDCKRLSFIYTQVTFISVKFCVAISFCENDTRIANKCVERENVRLSYINKIFMSSKLLQLCAYLNIHIYKVQVSSISIFELLIKF